MLQFCIFKLPLAIEYIKQGEVVASTKVPTVTDAMSFCLKCQPGQELTNGLRAWNTIEQIYTRLASGKKFNVVRLTATGKSSAD